MRDLFSSRWIAVLIALFVLAFSVSSFAYQGTLGSVAGTVRDTSGAVVSGAKVTLKSAATGEVRTTTSTNEGAFVFNQVNNGKYAVTIERDGFTSATYNEVEVLPGQQYSLNASLKVGGTTETVEVTAGQDLVHTTSSEIANTVSQAQVLNLPLLNRNPIVLIMNQAGVPGTATRNNTAINGARPGWTQVTQDGINIQDNFIRNNGLDFVPNRPTSDTIAEFSIVTNNVGADSVGGTSQVKLVTPSGSNAYHGSLYEYNRNNVLSANSYFNKHVIAPQTPTPRPFLNLNQFGGRVGGPVLKDKLFFFGSYEGYRQRQQVTQRNVVPAFDDYLTGNFRYFDATNTVRTVNVISLVNARRGSLPALGIDSAIQSQILSKIRPASSANTFSCGAGQAIDSTPTQLLNTGCDQFLAGRTTNRDQAAASLDYLFNSKHKFRAVAQRFTDFDDRTDIDFYNTKTNAFLPTKTLLLVGAWSWTISPTLINEFRAGNNDVFAPFATTYGTPSVVFQQTISGATNNNGTGLLNGLNLQNPNDQFSPQGRTVTTRQYQDTANWSKGNHNVTFGFSYQSVQPHPYNFASVMPSVTFGFAPTGANAGYTLVSSNLPAAPRDGQTIINQMNNLAAFLSGTITTVAQSYQTKDVSSGYVPGFPSKRAFEFSILSPYVQDSWRLRSNLTVTAGIKWEYWSPIKETNGLALLPDINGNDLQGSLLNPNGTVSQHKQFWKPDYNQFAPNVGFAWDPWKNGKTAIRGGYSMAFVNEDEVTAAQNAINGNFGLVGSLSVTNISGLNYAQALATNTLNLPPPAFQTNRTYLQQLAPTAGGVTAAAFAVQPNLRTPYAHEINFGIERELPWDSVFEARYVGTMGRDLWRGVDYNQQKSGNNPAFLADFQRARSNLFNCGAAAAPGSCAAGQALQFFPTFDQAGLLTNSSVLALIRAGEVGELANLYVMNPGTFPNARATFLPNSNIYAADGLINGAETNYHALQLEGRRRYKNGLTAQLNYTFSKNLADNAGNSQSRFEPLTDNARPHLEYGRSEFDITHIINGNFVYELPIGRGKRWLNTDNPVLSRIVSGWSTGQIINWQSGNPIAILSGTSRGTFNREGRSTTVTAFSTLSRDQIKKLLGLKRDPVTGNLYWIDPSVIAPSGRGVGTVNGVGTGNTGFDPLSYTPTFAGQVFYNPQPGDVGNMQRLQFDGPSTYNWNLSAAKKTRVTERIGTEFRADIFNVLNQATFFLGDTNINSTTFGRVTQNSNTRRIVQLSLRVDF